MSVDQFEVIDIASISKSGEVVLIISDHLDWSDTVEHQVTLQKKLNGYLAFVEGGQILQQYPDARQRPIVFQVVFKFEPDESGRLFLQRANKVIESAGFAFRDRLFAESNNTE